MALHLLTVQWFLSSLLLASYSDQKMDSIIETQRASHEELERYEQALAEVLMQNPSVVSTL